MSDATDTQSCDTRSWTIRLTDDDQAVLAALCSRYGLKRPDAVRRAIREVLAPQPRLTVSRSGVFVPLSSDRRATFPVRLKREVPDGG